MDDHVRPEETIVRDVRGRGVDATQERHRLAQMTLSGVEFVTEPQSLNERGHRSRHEGTSCSMGTLATRVAAMTEDLARQDVVRDARGGPGSTERGRKGRAPQ